MRSNEKAHFHLTGPLSSGQTRLSRRVTSSQVKWQSLDFWVSPGHCLSLGFKVLDRELWAIGLHLARLKRFFSNCSAKDHRGWEGHQAGGDWMKETMSGRDHRWERPWVEETMAGEDHGWGRHGWGRYGWGTMSGRDGTREPEKKLLRKDQKNRDRKWDVSEPRRWMGWDIERKRPSLAVDKGVGEEGQWPVENNSDTSFRKSQCSVVFANYICLETHI